MRGMIVGIAAVLAVSIAGPAWAEDMTEEIQEEEQPGSEIEIDMGGGKAQIERKTSDIAAIAAELGTPNGGSHAIDSAAERPSG